MDTIAHITLFDTHPFYQQSFVKAMSFLVKTGQAQQSDFDFMIEMKKKRGRFSSEPLEQIKTLYRIGIEIFGVRYHRTCETFCTE